MSKKELLELGFTDRILSLLDNPIELDKEYRVFRLHTGSKVRIIQEPKTELKSVQKKIIKYLNDFPFYSCCTARHSLSVVDNASPHHGSKLILKCDIKDFFPNTTIRKIWAGMRCGDYHYDDIIVPIALACTITKGGQRVLPTGAPTSPILANIAATVFDGKLLILASDCGATYTRYVDDITFSFKEEKDPDFKRRFVNTVYDLLDSDGYKPNRKKTKWIRPNHGEKFAVTGVTLKAPDIKSMAPREARRLCRARLNSLARANITQLDQITKGYLSYIKMLDEDAHNKLLEYYQERLGYTREHLGGSRTCTQ